MFGDRDVDDFHDVFHCLNAQTGETNWEVKRLAIGALDYGNSPRATPLIQGNRVFCLGALGVLICIDLTTGDVVWERNLGEEFKPAGDLPWGYCGSPLIADGKLIVAPGAADASVIALNPSDGSTLWKSPGNAPSYGSLNVANVAGKIQIVGHDRKTLGGWDAASGRRIWTLQPPVPGDFNVPTPIIDNGRLLITTENNGARLLQINPDGKVDARPIAGNSRLRPDMSTATLAGDRLYCVNKFLYCLNLKNNLKEEWRIRDPTISEYASILASNDRILVVGDGVLLLLPANGGSNVLSRMKLFDDKLPVYSHPAVVGNRLFIRGETSIVCIVL